MSCYNTPCIIIEMKFLKSTKFCFFLLKILILYNKIYCNRLKRNLIYWYEANN